MTFSIGVLAQRSGVPAKTIRYYEQIRLLPQPTRAANGYRRYADRDVHELRFVRRARELGFSIDEVAKLLALWRKPDRASGDVRAMALSHLDDVDRKIAELQGLRQTLVDLVERCHGGERPDCPILDDLAQEER